MKAWIPVVLSCSFLVPSAACAGGGFSTAPAAALPAPLDDAKASRHQIILSGAPIAYPAPAGHLPKIAT